ncbi:MAG: alpha/beta hydrolase [Acidobacteriota bacterium]|nr:alpha/beta hydrolase [Acidobacteriota bacterium]
MFRRLFGVVPALLSLSRTRRVRESDLLLPPSPPLPPLAEAVTRRNVELPLPGGAAGRALRGWYLERPGNLRTLIYFPGNQESLLRIAWRLHWMADNLDVNVLAFDYRGYGFSDGRATLGTIAYDGAVIYDHLEEVQPEGAGLPVIYGRSIGSLAAIETAVSRPVAGLILEGAPSAASDVIPSWRKMAPWYLRWLLRVRPDPALAARRPQPIDRIGDLRAPLLALHAGEDRIVPPVFGRRLFDAAGSKDKRWCPVPGATHNSLRIDRDPALGCLREFLQR